MWNNITIASHLRKGWIYMICNLCGKELPDGAAYCDGCGNSFGISAPEPEAVPAVEAAAEEASSEIQPAEMQPAPEAPAAPRKIKSHMVMAIFSAVVLFNWMLGIPAIVFARECELAADKGQWDIAERFSRRALSYTWVGVALNLALAAFITLYAVVMRAAGPYLIYMR